MNINTQTLYNSSNITPSEILDYMDVILQKPIVNFTHNISYDSMMELINTLSNDLQVFHSRDIIMKDYLNTLLNEVNNLSAHHDYVEVLSSYKELMIAYDRTINNNMTHFQIRVKKLKECYIQYAQFHASHASNVNPPQEPNNIPQQISHIENNKCLKRKNDEYNHDEYMDINKRLRG